MNFTNSSTGTISTYAWTFGDGGISNTASPSHVYSIPGVYSVRLTVTGPGGSNTKTATNYVTVAAPPPPPAFVNASFEIPAIGSTYRYAPTGAGIGWTFSPLSGIQGNGSSWAAAPAPNGTQTAFIQSTGSISQALSLNAGTYTLTLQAAQRFCGDMLCTQRIRIAVDGIQVGSLVSPAGTSFSPFSVTFSVATSGSIPSR